MPVVCLFCCLPSLISGRQQGEKQNKYRRVWESQQFLILIFSYYRCHPIAKKCFVAVDKTGTKKSIGLMISSLKPSSCQCRKLHSPSLLNPCSDIHLLWLFTTPSFICGNTFSILKHLRKQFKACFSNRKVTPSPRPSPRTAPST